MYFQIITSILHFTPNLIIKYIIQYTAIFTLEI